MASARTGQQEPTARKHNHHHSISYTLYDYFVSSYYVKFDCMGVDHLVKYTSGSKCYMMVPIPELCESSSCLLSVCTKTHTRKPTGTIYGVGRNIWKEATTGTQYWVHETYFVEAPTENPMKILCGQLLHYITGTCTTFRSTVLRTCSGGAYSYSSSHFPFTGRYGTE